MKSNFPFLKFAGAVLSLVLAAWPNTVSAADAAQVFSTPEAAVAALGKAVSTTNRAALGTLLGSASEALVNPDEVQGASELSKFSEAFNATNRLVRESDTRMTLEIGPDGWPFPIPLVKVASGWHFDTAAGLDELLNRRIGRNELDVLRVMRACVQAQREYASRDRDGDEVLEYAQKFASTEGKTDGLYWPTELNGEISPLGPMVADAQSEGYFDESTRAKVGPQPFHGYLFKILKSQGKNAPGGKYDYVINGHMIGGFAFVAWPAEYGESGIMTFIVNQQGRVFQKDLGKATDKTASKMTTYDPDPSWKVSPD
ncbi:MAG TPA: DUF2950 domain-containing protein [Verrucomicrobiae bacterium]|nr:DUF2950 domain-containing protein [Verrucomicrobiae bacterium]